MLSYQSLFSALVLFLFSTSTLAAGSISLKGVGYRIEPIAGYETVYRDSPSPHTSTRVIYGARASAGPDFLSAELEYTKGSDTENFSSAPEKIYTDDEKAKLGLRSTYHLSTYVFITGRAGGQGTRGYTETTTNGVMVRKDDPIKYHPYAGASLGVHFGSMVSISAGTTVVFRDNGDMSKNDVQNTLSVSIGL